MRPASSEARPSVADTVSASDAANDSGSEPYFRVFASSFALSAVNEPVIDVELPAGVAPWTTGALTTLESSVNAACLPMFCDVNVAQVLLPSDLNVRLTSCRDCWEL